MFSPFPVRHRWRLSNSEGDGPSTPGLHKRFTKRFSQFCRRKRNKTDAKVAAKTKHTWNTTSNNGNDDRESIGQDMTYKALSLLFKSGYPVANILARARLQIQQNVLNAHSGHLGDLGPALRIGPFPTLDLVPQKLDISTGDQHRAAAGGPSSQKRPPGSPGKSGSNSKKPRKDRQSDDDKAQNDADGDGDEAQSDTDSDDDEDDEGDSSRDGPRFPLPKSSPDRKRFACPFYKYHPARYCNCKGLRITSISYVTQHIGRRHVLKQCTMDVQQTAQSTDDNSTYLERTTDPDKIVFYCPTCRDEFHGRGADVRWERHTGCQAKSIAQTGVLLPAEFEKLKEDVTATSGNDNKWGKIWRTLYPGTSIPTQYNEAETVAPIGVDVQPHNAIQHHPLPGAVNETYHPAPPQGFVQQVADFTQDPHTYFGDDRFTDMFNDSWGTADEIRDLNYATSHIPNPVPTDVPTTMRPGRFDPSFMQSLISATTQNPPFPNNAWAQNNYRGTQ
ncbi:hypothetical protein FOMA001_g5609 [Fusarium oxysporum f. sp. matthiolae]|nr:hypothetical protein FOMA001_g5609 [Fusarium oxysporum f. sp. matthiolae]